MKNKGHEKFLEEMKSIFGDTYDFSKFIYVNGRTKGIVVCSTHGEFLKLPKKLLLGSGCPYCSGKKKLNTSILQEKINEIYGPEIYDASEFNYINNKTKGIIKCIKHGAWEVRPDNLLHGETRCPKCAGSLSKIEEELRSEILQYDSEVLFNDKSILDGNELDIFSPTYNLAFELNGLYFHSEKNGKNKNYHLNKTKKCKEKNIQLFHIFEDEWRNKRLIWNSIIRNAFKKNNIKIYARKCEIRNVSTLEKNIFLDNNHLQGSNDQASICIGLYINNELVSLLTMRKSIRNINYEWEIARFCSKLNHSVIGGFTKLLKYFRDNYNPNSIITYADKRISEGSLYKFAGFNEREDDSPPNYFYFDKHNLIRKSRETCQKHKLHKFLKNYDANMSESENMFANGYDRIWDCGSKVYTWTK